MNRSPLFYPLNRGSDADAGGAADLQTDVMRFMAILSLCLVAIFALVQSIPLAPTSGQDDLDDASVQQGSGQVPEASETEPVSVPETAKTIAAESQLVRPARSTPSPLSAVDLRRPTPARPDPTPDDVTESVPPQPGGDELQQNLMAEEQGFTLQFETDQALARLVETQVVGLYAMTREDALRLNVSRGRLSFWPASIPARFHEMDESTVPNFILAAYPKTNFTPVSWGVTLPANMARELDDYLASATGGSLTITSNGQLKLL